MRAVVYRAPETFDVEDVADRPLAAGEVRIANVIVGVCGTDNHIHHGGFGVKFPLTPGHEIVGQVIEISTGVVGVDEGDLVAVDNTVHCRVCENCKRGKFGLCKNYDALGVTSPGGFAEHVIARAEKCYSVADLGLDQAALIEPASCVVHGMDVLGLAPASDVLVIGAGPTGQIVSQLVVHGGSARVTVAAPTQFKLDLAAAYGANETVLLDRHDFAASAAALRDLAPNGFDVVIEASGAIAVLENVLPHVADGGTLLVYGMADEGRTIDVEPYEIFRRELTIKGAFAQAYEFARAIDFLRAGKIRTDGLITHRFGLDAYDDALASLRAPDCLKAVVVPNG